VKLKRRSSKEPRARSLVPCCVEKEFKTYHSRIFRHKGTKNTKKKQKNKKTKKFNTEGISKITAKQKNSRIF
jgi:hypothetical protein